MDMKVVKFCEQNIVLTGFMCSGKTHVGKIIAQKLGKKFVDTDEQIARFLNMSILDIFNRYGELYFREIEFEICEQICNLRNYVIASGGGTLINKKNYNLFNDNSLIIFIDTSFEVCYQRCVESNNRPLFNNLSKNDLYKLFLKRRKIYCDIADIVFKNIIF